MVGMKLKASKLVTRKVETKEILQKSLGKNLET
jgi:hypothetical protein